MGRSRAARVAHRAWPGAPIRAQYRLGNRPRIGPTRFSGVWASSVSRSSFVPPSPNRFVGQVVADPGPEARRAHPPPEPVEEAPALDVDHLEVARRRVAVDRPVERGRRAAARAPGPGDVAGEEVGHRLVGERLAGLVVADEPVEPLVGDLVADEPGELAGRQPARDPDRPRRLEARARRRSRPRRTSGTGRRPSGSGSA